VAYQAVWAIANIASDNVRNRDLLLKEGALENLLDFIDRNRDEKIYVADSCWALSNLCRNRPLPPYRRVEKAIALFC